MNISNLLPKLIDQASSQRNNAILFHFGFETLNAMGVFFARSKTMTIGIKGRNVGWQIDVSDGTISSFIPKEAYFQICDVLRDKDGARCNNPFFSKLISVLEGTAQSPNLQSPADEEIMELIGSCKTMDKKYEPEEGDKPFFDHWRRVRPSKEAKNKIRRYFGVEVREACYKNRITAVWSANPTDRSLLFLNPEKAIREIESSEAVK